MIDTDTFLTTLYVAADDFCKRQTMPTCPGKDPALTPGEVLTLALFGQVNKFESERAFYRYATSHMKAAFPTMPVRSQFNRLVRRSHDLIVAFFLDLAVGAKEAPYEALDTTAVPTRNAKRRGHGHLLGLADIGKSKRLGWYEGFHLMLSVTPSGVVTGYGFAAASTKEQPLADVFFSLRHQPEMAQQAGLAHIGAPATGPYVCDKGFEGEERARAWQQQAGATVITAPKRSTKKRRWPKALRRWLASVRQIVETAIGALQARFDLGKDRPHTLSGFRARLAAKMALHNFCIWLNRQQQRNDLAFADLIDW